MQGTKVLEDREVRHSLCYATEDAPRRQASQSILRYTGTQGVPGWTDKEQGSVFGFDNCARSSGQTDKFKTLCNIQADVSSAPYQRKRGRGGAICYTRSFDVILLVGLTELKAQIGWIDAETVSFQSFILPITRADFLDLRTQGTENRFEIPFPEPLVPTAELIFQECCRSCIR